MRRDMTTYGKTPLGQLLYDLAFTELSDRYLARKHLMPIVRVRKLRAQKDIVALRRKVRRERKAA
jgi:hypothetical protein